MIITYYGVSCFKIQSGDIIFVFDPPSKKSKFKSPRFQADIVLISHNHPNHNGYEVIASRNDRASFLINSPGEYEIRGVSIQGIRTFHDAVSGKKFGLNTVYVLKSEDISLCHLGDFGEKELRGEVFEKIGEVDVLFMPIDGGMIDFDRAASLINQIEPKIVIPMHFSEKKLNDFLKEFAKEKIEPLEKISLKKKDLLEKNREIVILRSLIN